MTLKKCGWKNGPLDISSRDNLSYAKNRDKDRVFTFFRKLQKMVDNL